MNKLKSLLVLSLIAILTTSCSSDDKENEVVFNALTSSKTYLFLEDVAIVSIDGTGYTESNLTTTNSKIKITKVATSSYEISSTQATSAILYAELKNNEKKQIKSIFINFSEHGVKNLNTVEGITINIDNTTKISKLLGEPERIADFSNGLAEEWSYYSKGFSITIDKRTSIAKAFNLFSSNYYYTNTDNIKTYYTNYPYTIDNGWKINNPNTTMDMVITALGLPSAKNTSVNSLNNRGYQFINNQRWFRFYSNSEDDYIGKKIIQCTIY